MLISLIILALLVSIDSFSIGLTYGLRGAKVNILSRFVLILISITFSSISIYIGSLITDIFPDFIIPVISGIILIIIGVLVIYDPIPFDFDNSKQIDLKEAFFLGITLSLDSVCVGIGSSIGNKFAFLFPILVAFFSISFLSVGISFGKKFVVNKHFSDNMLNIVSGIFLILIGISKFIC